ncbi:MAG: hypothetical protein J6K25_12645 [Thermoguttaceae bacterium]|nr:hypothetical protein [Thermoguttaceae bacterium]
MKTTLLNKIWKEISSRRFVSTAVCSCVSLFLVANAAPVAAQGDAAMRTIRPFIGFDETYQWSDVPEIVADGVKKEGGTAEEYAWATDLFFTKEIWQLEFSYKNIRTIEVDFPAENGKMERKRVWYLVYSVTNTGKCLRNELKKEKEAVAIEGAEQNGVEKYSVDVSLGGVRNADDEKFEAPSNNLSGLPAPQTVDYNGMAPNEDGSIPGAVRFAPRMIFASSSIQERLLYNKEKSGFFVGQKRGSEEGVYYDQYLPLAFAKIAVKEGRGQAFVDSVRMANRKIAPGETVWGIATWTDVDPRIDRFSVYVSGLTNALRWQDAADEETDENAGFGSGRDVFRKVLKLNFYNPGDEIHRGGKEIYNNLPGELDYQWIYM